MCLGWLARALLRGHPHLTTPAIVCSPHEGLLTDLPNRASMCGHMQTKARRERLQKAQLPGSSSILPSHLPSHSRPGPKLQPRLARVCSQARSLQGRHQRVPHHPGRLHSRCAQAPKAPRLDLVKPDDQEIMHSESFTWQHARIGLAQKQLASLRPQRCNSCSRPLRQELAGKQMGPAGSPNDFGEVWNRKFRARDIV